jgi:ATP-dependent Clp protease, protease subunit
LTERIVAPEAPIKDDVSNVVIPRLLFLESGDPDKDICRYINSLGGEVSAAEAIYGTMQRPRAPIDAICIGTALGPPGRPQTLRDT